MSDIRKLIAELGGEERRLRQTAFLAPRVAGGRVQTRIAGLVYSFQSLPEDFAGWGLFRPVERNTAALVEEAGPGQIDCYLQLFPQARMRVAWQMARSTWLAYPGNEGDARQRLGHVRPVPVHLCEAVEAFDAVLVRWDGSNCWYEDIDRRAEPHVSDLLRDALRREVAPKELAFSGLTPEMRAAYELAFLRALQTTNR